VLRPERRRRRSRQRLLFANRLVPPDGQRTTRLTPARRPALSCADGRRGLR
jgi:hypothetical protein